MKRVWKDIPEYEGLYQVSNYGEIRKICGKNYKYLKPTKEEYYRVSLIKNNKRKTFLVHRLVAETFIDNPNNYNQINHIDGNKQNNRVDNLEWCNSSYNIKDMYKRKGKYDKDKIIIENYKKMKSCNKVAQLFNMSGENVRNILKRNNVERY